MGAVGASSGTLSPNRSTREISVGKVANEPADDEDDESDAAKKAKLDLLSKKAPVLAHTPYWPEVRPVQDERPLSPLCSTLTPTIPAFHALCRTDRYAFGRWLSTSSRRR